MQLLAFLKSKLFFKHLAIFLLSLLFSLWAVFRYLDFYTLHQKTITVPDFKGIKVNKIDSFIATKHLHYLIIDSVFDAKKAKPWAGICARSAAPPMPCRSMNTK